MDSVGGSSALLGRPSGGLAEFSGARQVSWLATYRRRGLPGLSSSPVASKSVGTPLTVAGAATDRREAYRVPFSPSGKIEGPCTTYVPASRGVVKYSAISAIAGGRVCNLIAAYATGPDANVRKPTRVPRLDGFANPASPSALARTDLDEAADRRKRQTCDSRPGRLQRRARWHAYCCISRWRGMVGEDDVESLGLRRA